MGKAYHAHAEISSEVPALAACLRPPILHADQRPDAAPSDAPEAKVSPFALQFADDERFPFVNDPRGVAAAPSGWYVLDAGNYRVLQVTPSGDVRRTFGTEGAGPGELLDPRSIRWLIRLATGMKSGSWITAMADWCALDPTATRWLITDFVARAPFASRRIGFWSPRRARSTCWMPTTCRARTSKAWGRWMKKATMPEGTGNPYRDNEVSLTCLADGQVVVTYRNRPLVRLLSADGAIAQEWTLESPIIDLILTPPRQQGEAGIESLRPSGGPMFVPLMFGDPTLLPDGRLLIALQSAAFHTLDLSTGAQRTYAYMDLLTAAQEQREIAEEDWRGLWHVGVSAEGTLVAADPQMDELVVVELVD